MCCLPRIVRYELCLFVVDQAVSEPSEYLVPAVLALDEQGVPVSKTYGDIYRPHADPLAQARYVFLQGNQLSQRWRGRSVFTICETGFGLGHNFLALWEAWRADPDRPSRLHVISFEAHPFSAQDLLRYYQSTFDGHLRQLGEQLVHVWPVLVPGVHRMELEGGALTLTLLFGPVERTARQAHAAVDAFFLDGFSPKVNPAMWSPMLFGQLVRLANQGATAATWCTAGHVRRALQDSGFLVERQPGYGGKRHMTVARVRPELGQCVEMQSRPLRVAVVGAGIAGAAIASTLSQRGCDVHVFDPVLDQGLGGAHHGHSAIAVSPVFNRTDDLKSRLSRAGVLAAFRQWQELPEPARPRVCGTLYPSLTEPAALKDRQAIEQMCLSSDWVRWLTPAEALDHAGVSAVHGGVWFPYGQQISPEPLLAALLSRPGIHCHAVSIACLRERTPDQWILIDTAGASHAAFDKVVLANARGAHSLLNTLMPTEAMSRFNAATPSAGEVFDIKSWNAQQPTAMIAGHGYWLPALHGYTTVGSTYRRHATQADLTYEGLKDVLEKMKVLAPEPFANLSAGGLSECESGIPLAGWSGWRLSVSDRLPLLGPVNDSRSVWLATAYASRGFSWAALAGEFLAACWFHEPWPIEREWASRWAPR